METSHPKDTRSGAGSGKAKHLRVVPGGMLASKQSSNNRPFPPEENKDWSKRTADCCPEGPEGVQVWSRTVCWKEGVEKLIFTFGY